VSTTLIDSGCVSVGPDRPPLEGALLKWGAVVPEEHYLAAKFAATYADYNGRVRRWLSHRGAGQRREDHPGVARTVRSVP
jgi:hypothetical protein